MGTLTQRRYESGLTPTLQLADGRIAETVKAKTKLLNEYFFSRIQEADLSDINDTGYPDQIEFPEIPEIPRHEIERVVRSTPLDKAPVKTQSPIASGIKLYACQWSLTQSTKFSTPAYELATTRHIFNAQSRLSFARVARIGIRRCPRHTGLSRYLTRWANFLKQLSREESVLRSNQKAYLRKAT